ncbi:MAG: hypothetical protein IKV57_10285 [Clostridia bacterium]|nr:hypothetical protein [Clostridia bacterium]
MEGTLTLTIVTPDGGSTVIRCDSIRLPAAEGIRKNSGGSFGIRKGHTDALIAVDSGTVTALLGGKTVFTGTVSGGFAIVSGGDTVSILTDHLTDPVKTTE